MGWEVVAKGVNFYDLRETVANMELTKGTRMRVAMDLKVQVGWAFNVAGAELLFKPFIPSGMDLVDVYGQGNQGIVEMEADPAWLLAVLLFIKAHWLAIAIAGFALALIISLITVSIKIPAIAQIPLWLLVGAAIGIVGLTVLAKEKPT